MPAKQEPNIGINYGWAGGESGINLQLDENWRAIGALLQLSVLSRTTDIPASPVEGDRYIVPVGATGNWSGHDGKLARYIEGAWELYTPLKGWEVWVWDENQLYRHDGTGWKLPGDLYSQYVDDAAAASGGVPVGGLYVDSVAGGLKVRLT
ncbi:DUF2793 domain-containing protein [Marinobacter nauticus]|uniref:DUF2793 domain-containing protein n=1 Tax=Marinobacter nauticus TaxID=2743 RepID=A0A833JQC8_MARNT|nr:DUF2793 domain-containing protein [Marinobacter nauticus]KAE8546137.1 hypothetical protein F6453_1383 [Marinobacter nauticus]